MELLKKCQQKEMMYDKPRVYQGFTWKFFLSFDGNKMDRSK